MLKKKQKSKYYRGSTELQMDIMHFPMTVKQLLSWATLSLLKQVNEQANDGTWGEEYALE